MCLQTRFIRNPKYKPNKKNKGQPEIAKAAELLYVPIKCGECIECRREKAREWEFRLENEIKDDQSAHFITLTFDEKSLMKLKNETNNDNELCARAIELLCKRCERIIGTLKHWFINEQGHEGTERLHLHGFVWGMGAIDAVKEKWTFGYIFDSGTPQEGAIKYCVKYTYKFDERHPEFKQKVFASKGIGRKWLKTAEAQRMIEKEVEEPARLKDGRKMKLPMYFYRKIMNEEARERAFIAKQRDPYFWACGAKYKKTKQNYLHAKKVTDTKIDEMLRLGTGRLIRKKNNEKFGNIERNSYVCSELEKKNHEKEHLYFNQCDQL